MLAEKLQLRCARVNTSTLNYRMEKVYKNRDVDSLDAFLNMNNEWFVEELIFVNAKVQIISRPVTPTGKGKALRSPSLPSYILRCMQLYYSIMQYEW